MALLTPLSRVRRSVGAKHELLLLVVDDEAPVPELVPVEPEAGATYDASPQLLE
jgi:hypothetical protein